MIRHTPLRQSVEIEDVKDLIWKHEVRELLRGFCGALFVALPLLYTQEMWIRGRTIGPEVLFLIICITYLINLGYVSYSNFKSDIARVNIWWDAAISMLLGLIGSYITLFITARIGLNTPPEVCVSLLALMILPTSFGSSLAINQLGSREGGSKKSTADRVLSDDANKILATCLGGILFAFNIGPTIEPKLMLGSVGAKHAIAILTFSLLISYIIEHTARFHNAQESPSKHSVLASPLLSTVVTYLVALFVSAGLLWTFGYINTGTPMEMWVIWVIIVGYSTTLGGAAGRLIL